MPLQPSRVDRHYQIWSVRSGSVHLGVNLEQVKHVGREHGVSRQLVGLLQWNTGVEPTLRGGDTDHDGLPVAHSLARFPVRDQQRHTEDIGVAIGGRM